MAEPGNHEVDVQKTQEPKDDRYFRRIDPSKEPDAWVKSYSRAYRQTQPSHFDDRNHNGDWGMGEYGAEYVNEVTGERMKANQMVQAYIEELLKKDIGPITVIDFGAGEAGTLAHTAVALKDQVKEGKVRFIATNLNGKPTVADLETMPAHDRNSLNDFETCLKESLVDFQIADIVELRDRLKGQSVHLILTQNVFPFTSQVNDFILKTMAEMLDKDYGTLITGQSGLQDDLHPTSPSSIKEWATLNKGVQEVKAAGFTQKPDAPFKREKDVRISYTLFQAPNAPKFKLSGGYDYRS